MASGIKLHQKILFVILAPELTPQQVEDTARKINIIGPKIAYSQETTLYNHIYSLIITKIEDFLQTEEAKRIDKLAPHVSARATFRRPIEENLDRVLPQVFTVIAEQSPPTKTLLDRVWAILGY